jgi:RNA recognition motif-containing protein
MAKKLYVGNLSHDITDKELQEIFEAHGTVHSAQVIVDRETHRSKGFGFVEMGSEEEAQAAIDALNSQEVFGRPLTVNVARPREDRAGGGGFRKSGAGAGGGYRGGNGGGGGGNRRY